MQRQQLVILYSLVCAVRHKTVEQARAVLSLATLLGAELDPNDKALWICGECLNPLGEEGSWDSYHDEGDEVFHTDCCPRCSRHHDVSPRRGPPPGAQD